MPYNESTAIWRVFIVRYGETALLKQLVHSIIASDLHKVTDGHYEIIIINNNPKPFCDDPEKEWNPFATVVVSLGSTQEMTCSQILALDSMFDVCIHFKKNCQIWLLKPHIHTCI